MQVDDVRYYGKLPGENDYISRRCGVHDDIGLHDWMKEGSRFIMHYGGVTKAIVAAYGMLFVSGDRMSFGSVVYSHDSHDREYPFSWYLSASRSNGDVDTMVPVTGIADALAARMHMLTEESDILPVARMALTDDSAQIAALHDMKTRTLEDFARETSAVNGQDFHAYQGSVMHIIERLAGSGDGPGLAIRTGGDDLCSLVYWIMLAESILAAHGGVRHYLWRKENDKTFLIIVPGSLSGSLMKYLFDASHVSDIVIEPDVTLSAVPAQVTDTGVGIRLIDALQSYGGTIV